MSEINLSENFDEEFINRVINKCKTDKEFCVWKVLLNDGEKSFSMLREFVCQIHILEFG